MAKNVTIRPFARLLTMLGDQLIKNEQIAVIELIKMPMMQMQIGLGSLLRDSLSL